MCTLTNLLTPWCRVLLEKLTGLQLVKRFPAFHGTRRFITALTSDRHLSIYPHPTSWRSTLILSTHLHLGLPSGLLHSGFPTKTLYIPLSSPIVTDNKIIEQVRLFNILGNTISYKEDLDIDNILNNFLKITGTLNNVFRPQKKP